MSETGSPLALAGASVVFLALPVLHLALGAEAGAAMLLFAMATLLLVVGAHMALGIAGRPYLALGATAGLAVATTRGLVGSDIAWPLAMLGGILAGAVAQLVVAWLLRAHGRLTTAAASLLLGQLIVAQLGDAPAGAAIPETAAYFTGVALVLGGLLGVRALDNAMLADALRLARSAPRTARVLGVAEVPGRNVVLALAGLPAGAAGAILALVPEGQAAVPILAYPTHSLAVVAVVVAAAGGTLSTALLLATPILIVPPLAKSLAPILPDLTLAAAGAGVLLTLLLQPGGALAGLTRRLAPADDRSDRRPGTQRR